MPRGGEKFIYAQRDDEFPFLCLRKGQTVSLPGHREEEQISPFEDVDSADWIDRPQRIKLAAQTLFQQNGFSTTLLRLLNEDEDEQLEDTYDRFAESRRKE